MPFGLFTCCLGVLALSAVNSVGQGATDMGRRTEDKEAPAPRDSPPKVDADENIGRLAMSFFQACTRVSDSDEDILPQEDSEDMRMSVFAAFAELFPESIGDDGHAGERMLEM